jgi:rhodanese-related sulfurtransferase
MHFIQNNLLLVGLAVISGVMLLWPLVSRFFGGARQVDTLEAVRKINHDDALVIDVREPAEVAQGKIARAKLIPMGELQKRIGELEKHKTKPIIMVCRSGNRSAGACGILGKHGFTDVYNLAGGMIAWEQSNLPVEK